MDKPILVTAGIIKKENLYLIAQRKKDSLLEPNKWEFPGGKIKYLEHPDDCLIREIKEELNINIIIDELFSINSHVYLKESDKYHIILLFFLAKYVNGDLKNCDCQNSKWISIDEFQNYIFAEADIPIVKQLINQNHE